MQKGIRSLIWLVFVVVLSTTALTILEQWEKKKVSEEQDVIRATATAFFVAYDGEEAEELGDLSGYERVGCEDILVPYEIPVVSRRLKSVLVALADFEPPLGLKNPFREKGLSIIDVQSRGHKSTIIDISGELKLGGVCDTPRIKGQIEAIVSLYEENYVIRMNGSEENYDCMGDLRGGCR